jgi:two-component system sensor histidine kinase YesM
MKVRFSKSDRILTISIEDNGDELTDETLTALQGSLSGPISSDSSRETTGMLNICRRLQIFYRKQEVMVVARSDMGGMRVDLQIPFDSGGAANHVSIADR